MRGTIHYSKHGHIQVIGENNLVYYTGLPINSFHLNKKAIVEFDVIDEKLSKAKIIREIK